LDRRAYILSSNPNIKELETQDHNFCLSLNDNFDKDNFIISEIYWRCRLSSAKYKLKTNSRTKEERDFNADVTDVVTKISLKIGEVSESLFDIENKKIDEQHHKKCVELGFTFDTEDRTKIDDYYSCRGRLVDEDNFSPIFGNSSYAKYGRDSYDLSFIIDQRIEKKLEEQKSKTEKYQNCKKFDVKTINFSQCMEASEKSWKCLDGIEKEKIKKKAEYKLSCQKKTYLLFPNELMKETDPQLLDIERMKVNSDYYNGQNFASIGMGQNEIRNISNSLLIDKKINEEKKQKEAEKKQKEKDINSKKWLYSRNELSRLRQKYATSCQLDAEIKISEYINNMILSCKSIADVDYDLSNK
jgi:hypothetical protein